MTGLSNVLSLAAVVISVFPYTASLFGRSDPALKVGGAGFSCDCRCPTLEIGQIDSGGGSGFGLLEIFGFVGIVVCYTCWHLWKSLSGLELEDVGGDSHRSV